MKKLTALFLALALALSLTACGQSKAARAVDDQIAAIGAVTLDSGDAITAAEAARDALQESDLKQLKNTAALEEARAAYDALVLEAERTAAAADIDSLIAAIGTVTLDSAGAIAAARAAYDAADAEVQARVTGFDTLDSAEAQLADLRVRAVIDLINAIGEVNSGSGDAIQAAQDAYDALGGDADRVGSARDKLAEAQTAYQELKKAEAAKLLSQFRLEDDPVRGMKFYSSKVQPYYADVRSYVLPYIGMNSKDEVWLCAQLHYTGDNWVFFKKIIFSVDGKNTEKSYSYFNDIVRDNAYGNVWEYVNTANGSEYEDIFRAIASSGTTIVRFQGDNYRYDLTVSQKDKDAIQTVLDAYDALIAAGYKRIG